MFWWTSVELANTTIKRKTALSVEIYSVFLNNYY